MNELDIAGMEAMVGANRLSADGFDCHPLHRDDRRLCRDCAKAAGWDR